ncbi:hypothetical protein ACRYCC_04810 [Actinomadura scrupuli]|uniref:hypothetical protein n=1 Tax=Actinomadura scrupuli TaxID=559629 RepID=UPI003D985503
MKRALAILALLCCIAPVAAPAASAQTAAGDWRRVGLPFLWPNAGLTDISAAGPSDVWITGVQGAICIPQIASWGCSWSSDGNPVARRWNGSAWKEYPLPGYSGNGQLSMVTAAAPDDVWVASDFPYQPRYLAHFDGSAFTKIESPVPDAYVKVFAGQSGTWLTTSVLNGDTGLYRRVGGTWQATPAGDISYLMDVRARTATDAWAVGALRGSGFDRAAVAHWDGQAWQPVAYPRNDPRLTGVLPVTATDVWATVSGAGYVVRWNGSAWSQVDLPAGVTNVELVLDGSGTVWAGGQETVIVDGYPRRRPILMSYTGGAWQRVTLATPWGASEMAISGLTSVPGTGAIWLAANSTIGPVVLTNG